MLPLSQKYAFLMFALLTLAWGAHGFYRLYLRIRRGRPDTRPANGHIVQRFWYALRTTLRRLGPSEKRTLVSIFHAFIFYGFVFYILVNFVDAIEGYTSFSISSKTVPGAIYNLFADVLSFLVLLGVVALVVRRFFLPASRDFRFNANTLLHPDVRRGYISWDSLDRLGLHPVSCDKPGHRSGRAAGTARSGQISTVRYAAFSSLHAAECVCMAHLRLLGSAWQRAAVPRVFSLHKARPYLYGAGEVFLRATFRFGCSAAGRNQPEC